MSRSHLRLFIFFGMWVLFIEILVLMGKHWYDYRGLALWSDAWTYTTSQNLLDPYSASHILRGVLSYWFLCSVASWLCWHYYDTWINPLTCNKYFDTAGIMMVAVGLEMLWEIFENSPYIVEYYRRNTASTGYTGDTILNSVGDVLCMMLGVCFAKRFGFAWSIWLFLVLELWALYVARDNLTLNILMLVYPVQAIKDWQLST